MTSVELNALDLDNEIHNQDLILHYFAAFLMLFRLSTGER